MRSFFPGKGRGERRLGRLSAAFLLRTRDPSFSTSQRRGGKVLPLSLLRVSVFPVADHFPWMKVLRFPLTLKSPQAPSGKNQCSILSEEVPRTHLPAGGVRRLGDDAPPAVEKTSR